VPFVAAGAVISTFTLQQALTLVIAPANPQAGGVVAKIPFNFVSFVASAPLIPHLVLFGEMFLEQQL